MATRETLNREILTYAVRQGEGDYPWDVYDSDGEFVDNFVTRREAVECAREMTDAAIEEEEERIEEEYQEELAQEEAEEKQELISMFTEWVEKKDLETLRGLAKYLQI